MSNFFQLFVAWGVLLLVLLSLYLIDKVNVIHSKHTGAEIPQTYTDSLFADLSGKTLWDAMSGIPMAGYPPDLVQKLRPHYEPVIRQHIEHVFMQGQQDGQRKEQSIPRNVASFPTPRGSLESWLPMHHVASLYQVGVDHAQHPDHWLNNQQTLDQVVAMLYARAGLLLEEPFSRHLMVREMPELDKALAAPEATPADGAQANVTPALAGPHEPGEHATNESALPAEEAQAQSLDEGTSLNLPSQQVPA
jgi:hypothetical protein